MWLEARYQHGWISVCPGLFLGVRSVGPPLSGGRPPNQHVSSHYRTTKGKKLRNYFTIIAEDFLQWNWPCMKLHDCLRVIFKMYSLKSNKIKTNRMFILCSTYNFVHHKFSLVYNSNQCPFCPLPRGLTVFILGGGWPK
jgi:hypothetical protein